MKKWCPHVTVATVVHRQNRFLLVKEKPSGREVYNQPAGHLEQGESLAQAAIRETLEETGWHVELTGLLALSRYHSPANNVTYIRTSFIAQPVRQSDTARLDPDIISTHWLNFDQIVALGTQLRSPMVLADIERYRSGISFPLELLRDYSVE